MIDIFSDDENLERFYEVHRNVRITSKGLISYMVLIIQHSHLCSIRGEQASYAG